MLRCLVGHLLDDGAYIARYANCYVSILPDGRLRGVDLDNFGLGGYGRRRCVAENDVLLAAQQQDHVRLAKQARRLVKARVEEAVTVGVAVCDQTPGVALGHDRQVRGLDKFLNWSCRFVVRRGAARDYQRPLGVPEQSDGISDLFGRSNRA